MSTDIATGPPVREPDGPPWWRRPWWHSSAVPWSILAGVALAALAIVVAVRPIQDIDLYWHLIVGADIRSGVPVTQAGRGWSFAPVPDTWVSSQWLAEILLSWLYSWGGWAALIGYRTVSALLALAVTGLVTLRGRPVRAGVLPFTFAAIALGSTSQERSQQLTYLLAPLLGWWAERLIRDGRLPRWWVVLPLVVVWSNFHGGWVLLPAVLGVAALARLVDHGLRDRAAWFAIGLAALTPFAAMISPLGPRNAVTALTFSGAASDAIAEWARVALFSDQGWQLGALLVLAVLCWVFGAARPSRGEVLFVLAAIAFGFLAYRNITPTALVLAPVLTGTMTRALGPGPAGRTPLVWVAWLVGGLGVAAAVVLAVTLPRDLQAGRPVALYQQIGAHPGQVRVLNTYNAAGPLLLFAGGPAQVQLGIDGRTDKYGADYISRYLSMFSARPGWQSMFRSLHPDVVLAYGGEAIVPALQEQGWRIVASGGGMVLLAPADTAASWRS